MSERVTPSAIEIERIVIGTVIEYPDRLPDIIEVLSQTSFYDTANRKVWSHLEKMYEGGRKLDRLTLVDSMKKSGDLDSIGGITAILDYCNPIVVDSNLEEHTYIVKQKEIQREFIKLTTQALADAYDRDVDVLDIVDGHLTSINALTALNGANKEKWSKQLWSDLMKQIKASRENLAKGITSGVGSGLVALDNITNGWQPPDLIIFAGRPGMGKSALAKKCIMAAIKEEDPVLVFSLEMSSMQWMARIASEETGLQAEKFIAGKSNITFDEKLDALAKTYSVNGMELLCIDDTPALSIPAMKARAKRIFYSMKNRPKLIIVDYIQLMSAANKRGGNREQDVSEMSRGLKEMAKELNVPVIALSQLSRAVETRGGDKRPQLSDLRESGAIEQDADMVIFIYRPEYYYKQGEARFSTVELENGEIVDSKGLAEIIISKNRNGAAGSVMVKYVDYLTKFTNIDDSETLPF